MGADLPIQLVLCCVDYLDARRLGGAGVPSRSGGCGHGHCACGHRGGHSCGKTTCHGHGAARLRHGVLFEYLVNDRLPVGALPDLHRRSHGRLDGQRHRGRGRVSVRYHAGAPPQRSCCGGCAHAGFPSRRRFEGRAPPYAVLLGWLLPIVVLFLLGRDRGSPVARPIDRGGRFGAGGSAAAAAGMHHRHKAAAYHLDPRGVGGAAGQFPDPAIRPSARPDVPLA